MGCVGMRGLSSETGAEVLLMHLCIFLKLHVLRYSMFPLPEIAGIFLQKEDLLLTRAVLYDTIHLAFRLNVK